MEVSDVIDEETRGHCPNGHGVVTDERTEDLTQRDFLTLPDDQYKLRSMIHELFTNDLRVQTSPKSKNNF